jgi:hypothetical protein
LLIVRNPFGCLIANARHLERALTVFIDHYDTHRAHRSLDLAPPSARLAIAPVTEMEPIGASGVIRITFLRRAR